MESGTYAARSKCQRCSSGSGACHVLITLQWWSSAWAVGADPAAVAADSSADVVFVRR